MTDHDDYRRQMDDKIIGFLSAHEVWMAGDTAWKKEMSGDMRNVKNRVYALEKWRNYLAGAWAVVVAGWAFLTGHK